VRFQIFLFFGFPVLIVLSYLIYGTYMGRVEYHKGQEFYGKSQKITSLWKISSYAYFGPKNQRVQNTISNEIKENLIRNSILHLRRSLDWNVYFKAPREMMLKIAENAKEIKNFSLSIVAYQELRSSLYASRGLWQPYQNIIQEIDSAIFSLQPPENQNSMKGLSLESIDNFWKNSWIILSIFSFWGWILTTFLFIQRGFTKEGNPISKTLVPLSVLSLCLMFIWIFSLTRVS